MKSILKLSNFCLKFVLIVVVSAWAYGVLGSLSPYEEPRIKWNEILLHGFTVVYPVFVIWKISCWHNDETMAESELLWKLIMLLFSVFVAMWITAVLCLIGFDLNDWPT